MAKYHINPSTGNPGQCRAKGGNCPYGSPDEHYSSKDEAREAFEKGQVAFDRDVYPTYPYAIELDKETEKLLADLENFGARPLIVGGTVRDALASGVTPKDVDIEVYNLKSMDHLVKALRQNGYKVDEVGKSFGVIKTVLPSGMDIDLSLPRKDNLVGEGHRGFEVEVNPDLSLYEAAGRRDFTVNALYYDHGKKAIIDAHGGMADWQNKQLRHVSNAFSEDPLRVLRAVQFASRFDLTIAPETTELAKSIKGTFPSLSTERVQVEFEKFFLKGKNPTRGLEVLRDTQWGEHFGMNAQWFKDNDPEEVGKLIVDAQNEAKAHGKSPEIYGAATLMHRLPLEQRKAFMKQALIGDKPQNKALRIVNTEFKGDPTDRKTVNAWARSIASQGALSVEEWHIDARHNRDRYVADAVAATAKDNGSYVAPKHDMITGQLILDTTGEKKGGRWIGEVMRDAAKAQDEEVFLDQEGARAWLAERLKSVKL